MPSNTEITGASFCALSAAAATIDMLRFRIGTLPVLGACAEAGLLVAL